MPTLNIRRPIPWLNLLLLLLAATVSMATLKGEGGDNHGGATAGVNWLSWNDQHRQRLTITIAPVADRLDPLDHDGPIFLQIILSQVSGSLAASPHLTVSIMSSEGEEWALGGAFVDFVGEFVAGEHGPSNGELSAQIGRLCEDSETADDGCVPCHLSVGCVLTVEVDYCYTVGDHTVDADVWLTDASGELLALECLEGTDSEPCDRLKDWMVAVGESSDPGLCPAQ